MAQIPLLFRRNVAIFQLESIFSFFLFLYFFTLSVDLFNIEIVLFTIKLKHLFALFLIFYFTLKNRWMIEKKIFFSSILLLVSFTLSAFVSVYWFRSFSYALVFLFNLIAYFFLPISLMQNVQKERWLSLYFYSFKVFGVYAVLQFFFYSVGIKDPFVMQTVTETFGRAQGFAYEPSYYALFMSSFIFYYNAKFVLENRPFSFKNMVCLLVINLLLLVSTSTAAFFSYIVFCYSCSFFAFVIRSHWQVFRPLMKFVFFFFCVFSLILYSSPELFLNSFFKFFVVGFFTHGSFMGRWIGLINSWQVFLEHPWLGVGYGGVGTYLCQKEIFDGESGEMNFASLDQLKEFDPTNSFTELLASLGIVGLLAFAIFGFFYLRSFYCVLKRKEFSLEEKRKVASFLISIIVLLISLQFNQGLLRSYIWTHLGLCLGYVQSLETRVF